MMIVRVLVMRYLQIALGYMLILGLAPSILIIMPNMQMDRIMSSMQEVQMDTMSLSSQSNMPHEGADDHSTGSCCDAMGQSSLGCDFMVSQSACVALYGGGERVVNSAPLIQTTYIKNTTPPPKA